MPSGPVILNNTPLVAFWVLGQLALLRNLYGQVLIPSAVLAEFGAVETLARQEALAQAPWIVPVSLKNPHTALIYTGLDRGESEVLALAVEQEARLVIIDERRGRSFAQRLNLQLTGTLGVLLAAKRKGLITEIHPLIEALETAGLHLHPQLVANVLAAASEPIGEP